MIRLDRISKSFGTKVALEPLSLEVARGEIYGMLGHNGAGKSTTFGLLLGHLRPTGGEAFIQGHSVQRDRARALARVGAIFETPAFYDYLSGWRNLQMFTALTGRVSRTQLEETIRFVGLEKRINDLVRVYSHGMRQRLALAQALLPTPELILLDEPAEGLDPEGIREMRELILRLNQERGLTVVLSSHLLAEVESTCSRIAILNQGRLIFQGKWQDLGTDQPRYRLDLDDWARATPVLAASGGKIEEAVGEKVIALPPGRDVADLVAALVNSGVRVRAVEPVRQSLEEIYLQIIRTPARTVPASTTGI